MPTIKVVSTATVVGCLAFSVGLLAQWPSFPTAGAPKLANGQPNLNGPTPRTPDGKPDLSGVWTAGGPGGGLGGPGKGKGKGPPDGKGKGPGGPPPAVPNGSPGIVRGGFKNMAESMPGGLLPYQPGARELRDRRFADNSKDHPDAHCLPLNPIQLWFHPQPRKLIWNPREIVMIAESNGGLRQIFTDGRPLPNKDDVQPWWYGYSVGKWDGDTLVVDSTGFLDNAWIDENGSPLSNDAHVTERIRRPNYGTLEVEITVNDPKTYTRPWTVTANQRLMADDELIEFICGENNTSLPHLIGK
jgi:hypothetical protein